MFEGAVFETIWQNTQFLDPLRGELRPIRMDGLATCPLVPTIIPLFPAVLNTCSGYTPRGLPCERCHAGELMDYERRIEGEENVTIRGMRCSLRGYTELADDEAIWTAVGL
jgi:hypothetical protein